MNHYAVLWTDFATIINSEQEIVLFVYPDDVQMNSKAGKIAIVAGGVIAVGATLAYIWKNFIDVDDEEEEEKPVIGFTRGSDSQTVAAAEKKEEDIPNLRNLCER